MTSSYLPDLPRTLEQVTAAADFRSLGRLPKTRAPREKSSRGGPQSSAPHPQMQHQHPSSSSTARPKGRPGTLAPVEKHVASGSLSARPHLDRKIAAAALPSSSALLQDALSAAAGHKHGCNPPSLSSRLSASLMTPGLAPSCGNPDAGAGASDLVGALPWSARPTTSGNDASKPLPISARSRPTTSDIEMGSRQLIARRACDREERRLQPLAARPVTSGDEPSALTAPSTSRPRPITSANERGLHGGERSSSQHVAAAWKPGGAIEEQDLMSQFARHFASGSHGADGRVPPLTGRPFTSGENWVSESFGVRPTPSAEDWGQPLFASLSARPTSGVRPTSGKRPMSCRRPVSGRRPLASHPTGVVHITTRDATELLSARKNHRPVSGQKRPRKLPNPIEIDAVPASLRDPGLETKALPGPGGETWPFANTLAQSFCPLTEACEEECCGCGNFFVQDAEFCHKCGSKRLRLSPSLSKKNLKEGSPTGSRRMQTASNPPALPPATYASAVFQRKKSKTGLVSPSCSPPRSHQSSYQTLPSPRGVLETLPDCDGPEEKAFDNVTERESRGGDADAGGGGGARETATVSVSCGEFSVKLVDAALDDSEIESAEQSQPLGSRSRGNAGVLKQGRRRSRPTTANRHGVTLVGARPSTVGAPVALPQRTATVTVGNISMRLETSKSKRTVLAVPTADFYDEERDERRLVKASTSWLRAELAKGGDRAVRRGDKVLRELRESIRIELVDCLLVKTLEQVYTAAKAILDETVPGASPENISVSLARKLRDASWWAKPSTSALLATTSGMPPALSVDENRRRALKEVFSEEVRRRQAQIEGGDVDGAASSRQDNKKGSDFLPRRTCRASDQDDDFAVRGPGGLGNTLRKGGDTAMDGPLIPICAPVAEGSLVAYVTGEYTAPMTPESTERARQEVEKKAKEDVRSNAFQKLCEDNRVHQDDLPQALELSGFTMPDQEWIDQVYPTISKFSTLRREEFLRFVNSYVARQAKAFKEAFEAADEDGSGSVETEELANLLRSFGIEPMKHVLSEVIEEVDEDGGGTLCLEEFEHVMELLRTRNGFTKGEYEHFMDLFQRFDKDKTGEMDTKELIAVVTWLGFAVIPDFLDGVLKEVDVDGSGCINAREYLVCMKKIRDREIQGVKDAITANDADGSGTLSSAELADLLRSIGYIPDEDAVIEAARDSGVDMEDGVYVGGTVIELSECWRLLGVYRSREGFNKAEVDEIKQAFERYDKNNTGEISTLDIGKVLRWLGYPTPFEVQQHLTAQVDIDGSGQLDLGELRKMIRMYREKALKTMRAAFEDEDEDQLGLISVHEAQEALKAIGCADQAGRKLDIRDGDISTRTLPHSKDFGVDLYGFTRVALRHNRSSREAFRQNGGFSFEEVQKLKENFSKYDVDFSGDISNKELITLIEDLFPEMANDKVLRPLLIQLMREVDADGDGSLDFPDFLRLMRQFHDLQDRERVAKEQRAIEETCFSSTEVRGFRELFLVSDDGSGELSLSEVKRMIHMICPLGDKYIETLTKEFRKITGQQQRVEGNRDQADFPEFLWLMKRLLDVNFANLKEKTATPQHGSSSSSDKMGGGGGGGGGSALAAAASAIAEADADNTALQPP